MTAHDEEGFFGMIGEARDRLVLMIDASRALRGGDEGAMPSADSQAVHDLQLEAEYRTTGLDEPVSAFQTLSGILLSSAEDNILATCDLFRPRSRERRPASRTASHCWRWRRQAATH